VVLNNLASNNAGLHRYINALNVRTARLEAENAAFRQQLLRADPVAPQYQIPALPHPDSMSPGHLADNEETDHGEPQTPGHREDAASAGSRSAHSAHGSPLALVPAATPSRPTVPSTPSSRRTARAAPSVSGKKKAAAAPAVKPAVKEKEKALPTRSSGRGKAKVVEKDVFDLDSD